MINGILKNKINREKFNTTDKYTQKENLYFQSNSNKKGQRSLSVSKIKAQPR